MNPLYLILCSLDFVKSKGRMDENVMEKRDGEFKRKIAIWKQRNQNKNSAWGNGTQNLIDKIYLKGSELKISFKEEALGQDAKW